MQKHRVARRVLHQPGVDLVAGEHPFAGRRLRLLAHARPDVGIDGAGFAHRFQRIVGHLQVQLGDLRGQMLEKLRRESVAVGRGHGEPQPHLAAAFGQAAGHVVAIAHVGQCPAFDAAEDFLQRVQVGQRLAGMGQVGQAVDDRASAIFGQLGQSVVVIGADDDQIDVLAQHPGEIGHALSGAKADVVAQEQAAAAQMAHARLEADPSPQRGLFEQQGHHAPGQQGLAQALRELGLQVLGDGKNAIDLDRCQVGEIQ